MRSKDIRRKRRFVNKKIEILGAGGHVKVVGEIEY